MKSTVIYSDKVNEKFDGHETSKYIVKTVNQYGTFTSSVRVLDEDKDKANDFLGYSFAEYKNDIKALGVKVKYYEQRMIAAKSFLWNAKQCYDEGSEAVAFAARQYNLAKRDYHRLYDYYKSKRDGFKDYTDNAIKVRGMISELLDKRIESKKQD